MKKIKLEICCGTTCYLLGAANLMKLESSLPTSWSDNIEIIGIPCLDACSNENLGRAPFVRINGKLFGNATPDVVCAELRKLLDAEGRL